MKTLTICCPQLKTGKVKKDFEDLPSDVLSSFEAEMKKCNDWNGDFKSRKKREVGVEEVDNMEEDMEVDMEVEQFEGAGRLLSWAEDLLPRLVGIFMKLGQSRPTAGKA